MRLLLGLARKVGRRLYPAYGARTAAQNLTEALLRYASASRFEAFVDPRLLPAASRMIDYVRASSPTPREIVVRSYFEVGRVLGGAGLTAWYSAGPDFWVPSDLRRRWSDHIFPITATHFTISYQRLLHDFVLRLLLAESYPCDSFVCNSRAAMTALQNLMDYVRTDFNSRYGTELKFRGRFDLIPLSVDTDIFTPSDKLRARRQLRIPPDAFVVLYLGRLSLADKADLMPTVRTIKDMVHDREHRNLLLVIVGTQGRETVEDLTREAFSLRFLRKHVRFVLPDDDRHVLLSAADVFVSPADSIQESFGLTVIEAMACGIPQLVPAWDGYRETVEHGRTGFLVPTWWARCDADLCEASELFRGEATYDHLALAQSCAMDVGALRQYLGVLIRNPQLRREMGARSRERAVALFSYRAMASAYDSLWSELSARASAPLPRRGDTGVYSRPSYYGAFGHYASNRVRDCTRLTISKAGLRALAEGVSGLGVPSACTASGVLDPGLLAQGLGIISQGAGCLGSGRGGPIHDGWGHRFGDVVQGLAELDSRHPDFLRRQVMWLLKYGLVEVQPSL